MPAVETLRRAGPWLRASSPSSGARNGASLFLDRVTPLYCSPWMGPSVTLLFCQTSGGVTWVSTTPYMFAHEGLFGMAWQTKVDQINSIRSRHRVSGFLGWRKAGARSPLDTPTCSNPITSFARTWRWMKVFSDHRQTRSRDQQVDHALLPSHLARCGCGRRTVD